MAITLTTLRPAFGAKVTKKRVGRGLGSKGTTAGRGQKGQSSRSGVGGLKRLGMRHTLLATPKSRGFKSLATKPFTVDIGALSKKFIAGEVVSPRTLYKKGLLDDAGRQVKLLGGEGLTVAVTVKHCKVSATAKEAIIKAGGKVE